MQLNVSTKTNQLAHYLNQENRLNNRVVKTAFNSKQLEEIINNPGFGFFIIFEVVVGVAV